MDTFLSYLCGDCCVHCSVPPAVSLFSLLCELSHATVDTEHKLEPRDRKHIVSHCQRRVRWSSATFETVQTHNVENEQNLDCERCHRTGTKPPALPVSGHKPYEHTGASRLHHMAAAPSGPNSPSDAFAQWEDLQGSSSAAGRGTTCPTSPRRCQGSRTFVHWTLPTTIYRTKAPRSWPAR